MEKDRQADRRAIEWTSGLILQILKKLPLGCDRYRLLSIIQGMSDDERGIAPEGWQYTGYESHLHFVTKALEDLIYEKRVRAEPDDHTSIYILENPLDSIAKSV